MGGNISRLIFFLAFFYQDRHFAQEVFYWYILDSTGHNLHIFHSFWPIFTSLWVKANENHQDSLSFLSPSFKEAKNQPQAWNSFDIVWKLIGSLMLLSNCEKIKSSCILGYAFHQFLLSSPWKLWSSQKKRNPSLHWLCRNWFPQNLPTTSPSL